MKISSRFGRLMVLPALVWGQAAFATCGSDVIQSGNTFTVMPTGIDDTANIQCAFDEAVAAGPGATVKLIKGIYETNQIVVSGFVGRFLGENTNKTVVQNKKLEVTVADFDFFLEEPSSCPQKPCPDFAWPTIFAFIGGDFVVSDMTIKAVGEEPTEGWSFFGPYTELSSAIVVLGDRANIAVENVHVEGEETNGQFGYNLINGIFPQGDFGGYPGVQHQGDFLVGHSTFRKVYSAVPFGATQNYRAIMSHNTFDNVGFATEIFDIVDTVFKFSRNHVEDADYGLLVYEFGIFSPFGVESSNIEIKSNVFLGENGPRFSFPYPPFFPSTFGEDVRCRLINNDVSKVKNVGIYLSEGTRKCLVSGSGPGAVIVNLGSDNVVKPTPKSGRRFEK